jgi:hypothetical protein
MVERQITSEELDSLDKEHRENDWDWRHEWFPGPVPSHGEVPPISLSLLIAHLFAMYVESGLHASQSLCDHRDEVLKETRRLLGRIADEADHQSQSAPNR